MFEFSRPRVSTTVQGGGAQGGFGLLYKTSIVLPCSAIVSIIGARPPFHVRVDVPVANKARRFRRGVQGRLTLQTLRLVRLASGSRKAYGYQTAVRAELLPTLSAAMFASGPAR